MKVTIGPYAFEKNSSRNIDILIDDYDVWDMHDTLALIILPMLKMIKNKKYFYPQIDIEDLPSESHNKNIQEQWQNLIDEIIWAVEQRTLDDHGEDQFWDGVDYNYTLLEKHRMRIKNGFRLFGKYYLTLGD